MLTPIAAFTLLPFVDVIRSPHPPGVRCALDSPLEGGGFELSVPPHKIVRECPFSLWSGCHFRKIQRIGIRTVSRIGQITPSKI
jgi:hypothetical protein